MLHRTVPTAVLTALGALVLAGCLGEPAAEPVPTVPHTVAAMRPVVPDRLDTTRRVTPMRPVVADRLDTVPAAVPMRPIVPDRLDTVPVSGAPDPASCPAGATSAGTLPVDG